MSRAKIKHVAARAGVAVKTAMAELDYRPSVAARILSGAKSNQIALTYDNHSPHFMFKIQKGCRQVCHENGIRLLAQPFDVVDPRVGDQVRGLVSETHVDGIILSSPVTDCDPVLRALETMDVPFVRISPGTNHALISSVRMDDAQAAGVLAVAHDRGITVPAELCVAGFDDTTLARTATQILIAGADITHKRRPHDHVERASVAPPKRN